MRTYLNKVRDIAEDIRLGIRTRGTAATEKPGAVYYASVAFESTRDVLAELKLRRTDRFCDIGAGKGRVLALASQYPVAKVIGIEYEPALVAQARGNVQRLRKRRADIVVREGAAELFDYSDVTVAYCFNAVEADILDIILAKIRDDRDGRPFRIAFVMESPAQAAVFAKHDWLVRYGAWTDREGHPVTLYQSRPVRVAPSVSHSKRPMAEPALATHRDRPVRECARVEIVEEFRAPPRSGVAR